MLGGGIAAATLGGVLLLTGGKKVRSGRFGEARAVRGSSHGPLLGQSAHTDRSYDRIQASTIQGGPERVFNPS